MCIGKKSAKNYFLWPKRQRLAGLGTHTHTLSGCAGERIKENIKEMCSWKNIGEWREKKLKLREQHPSQVKMDSKNWVN